MNDLVYREELLKKWNELSESGRKNFAQVIITQPAANVVPIKHGYIIQTIEKGIYKRFYSCCNKDVTRLTCWINPKYCPNCGAKIINR